MFHSIVRLLHFRRDYAGEYFLTLGFHFQFSLLCSLVLYLSSFEIKWSGTVHPCALYPYARLHKAYLQMTQAANLPLRYLKELYHHLFDVYTPKIHAYGVQNTSSFGNTSLNVKLLSMQVFLSTWCIDLCSCRLPKCLFPIFSCIIPNIPQCIFCGLGFITLRFYLFHFSFGTS